MWFFYVVAVIVTIFTLFNTLLLISIATFLVRWRTNEQEGAMPTISREMQTRLPLEYSDGDNIPEEIISAQIPYNARPAGKLDRGF
jgi:hypothetical protein